ncbi:MAG: hypothetical protein AB3N19_00170, partial [Ruegeria sp.]
MFGWIKPPTLLKYAVVLAVFLFTFAFVVLVFGKLPEQRAFWQFLNLRFSQDERYQAQTLFLPDQKTEFSAVIVGDSLFQSSVPEWIAELPNTQRIIVNSYDPDDLRLVSRALVPGDRRTKSKVCAIIVQVSPLFSLRARSMGANSDPELLRSVLRKRGWEADVKLFFEILKKWANTERSLPDLDSEPGRPPRMVGQARFSDPNEENWERAFGSFDRYKGQIIGVFDDRDTDWGDGGDLVETTLRQ